MISQKYFQIYPPVHVHLKTDEVDLKKSHREKKLHFFFQSPHQVDMKNVVKLWKDFLLYFTTPKIYHECCHYLVAVAADFKNAGTNMQFMFIICI